VSFGRRPEFHPAQRAAGASDCAPDDIARISIQRPVNTAFLAESHDISHQVRTGAGEVIVVAFQLGTVSSRRHGGTVDGPNIDALQAFAPLHRARIEVERHGAVVIIIRRGAAGIGLIVRIGSLLALRRSPRATRFRSAEITRNDNWISRISSPRAFQRSR